jgi:hypothetical protein
MRRVIIIFCLFALMGFAAAASAQTKPVNPTQGTFTASPDHAQISSYVIGIFATATATTPVRTQDIGKPTPDATQTCAFTFSTQPVAFGVDYVARVKAVAGGAESVWSEVSNPFDRVPGPPSKIVIK